MKPDPSTAQEESTAVKAEIGSSDAKADAVKTEEGAAATAAAVTAAAADPFAGLVRRTARTAKSRLITVDGHQASDARMLHMLLCTCYPSPSLTHLVVWQLSVGS